jgi:hypothetical protein
MHGLANPKYPNNKLRENPSGGSRVVPRARMEGRTQTDRQTDGQARRI